MKYISGTIYLGSPPELADRSFVLTWEFLRDHLSKSLGSRWEQKLDEMWRSRVEWTGTDPQNVPSIGKPDTKRHPPTEVQ